MLRTLEYTRYLIYYAEHSIFCSWDEWQRRQQVKLKLRNYGYEVEEVPNTTRLNAYKDKEWHVKYTPGHITRVLKPETQKWEDTVSEAYECLSLDGQRKPGPSVDGAANATAASAAIPDVRVYIARIADGKNQSAFNMAALQDDRVKADGATYNALLNAAPAYMESLIAAGLLTKDESGIYHAKPSERR